MPCDYRFKLQIVDGAEFVLTEAVKREGRFSSLNEPVSIELFAIVEILSDRG